MKGALLNCGRRSKHACQDDDDKSKRTFDHQLFNLKDRSLQKFQNYRKKESVRMIASHRTFRSKKKKKRGQNSRCYVATRVLAESFIGTIHLFSFVRSFVRLTKNSRSFTSSERILFAFLSVPSLKNNPREIEFAAGT